MDHTTRILIADDRPRSRAGLRALLATCAGLEIVGEAVDGRQAIDMVEQHRPDVVLMDVQMPVLDGLAATRAIKARWPDIRVVILTLYSGHRANAKAAGADAFLIKGCSMDRLLRAVKGRREGGGVS
ncbi:MAG: response regulator transcription factor [Anaerolineae bacterium]|jgi:DNA-binding NarL/FixJ family response regulator